MKVIFLDFDGVILPIVSNGTLGQKPEPSRNAVDNLNALVAMSEASIVISSSWREHRTLRELNSLLQDWGVLFPAVGVTAANPNGDRGQEVEDFIAHNSWIDNFVILDDEPTDLEPLMRHTVLPNPTVGLSELDVYEAMRILYGYARI